MSLDKVLLMKEICSHVGCYFLVGVYGVETPPQPPIVFNLSVDDVHNIGDYVIAQDKAVFNHILSTVAPDNASFENTIAPWAHHSDEVNTLIAPLYYITDTAAHNATNDFYHARGPVLTNISTSDGFFALIKAVYDDLDSQDKLWTPEGALTVFYYQPRVDAGLSVAKGSQRAKYTSLVDQQLNLSRAWDANAYNPAQTTSLYFSPEELDGVDTQTLATFSNGTGVNEGKLEVIVDYDGYSVMSSAKSQRVRQEVDIASNRLAKDNVDILKQAYAGRDEMAQLLGYPDFATARLQNTIAGSTEAALALINEIKDTLKPKATDQVDQLDSIIKQENASSKAYRWDINYAGDAIDEAQTNLTDDNFDGYFVAKYTVPLALQQFGQAFGFDLQLLEGADLNTLSPTGKGSDILPDPNAVLYEVWSSGSNDFAGYLYSDVFTRPNKSSNGLRGISLRPSFTAANRTRYYPAALLNGGYTQDQHLDSDGLAALFWQMGVVYWTLSCESTFGDICGSSGAPTDFSQMVGQMMENFAYNPIVLQTLSKHYSYLSSNGTAQWKKDNPNTPQPPETLPEATANKAAVAKFSLKAITTLYKVWYSLYDFQTHMPDSHEAAQDLPINEIYNKLAVDVCLVPWGESVVRLADGSPDYNWGWGEASYYDWVHYWYGRWYSWTWAKVYSEDCYYSRFADDPFNAATGLEFRQKVLSRAGNPKQYVAEFLGREPSTKAFYRDVGLDV